MKVFVPSPLHRYTAGRSEVAGQGESISAVLFDLDRQYPGIRFRMIDEQDAIRPHIKLFVNGERCESLDRALAPSDEVHIIAALSGG